MLSAHLRTRFLFSALASVSLPTNEIAVFGGLRWRLKYTVIESLSATGSSPSHRIPPSIEPTRSGDRQLVRGSTASCTKG